MTAARIVFDLDGTLIDSAPDIQSIANAILGRENRPPITIEQTRAFIGDGSSVFVQRVRAVRDIADAEHERLLEAFLELYEDAVTLTKPYPGVARTLARLASRCSLGICTNKPLTATVAVLRHLDLDCFFDTVWGGDCLPVRKPDPAPLHAAFEALGTLGSCIYVGDSEVDAETARRAGVPFVLFSGGYRKTPVSTLPHAALVNHFDELPAAVSGLACIVRAD